MHDQTIIKCGYNLAKDRVQKDIRTYTNPNIVFSIKNISRESSKMIKNLQIVNCTSKNWFIKNVHVMKIIPNTAVFGPTNFIGTTTTIATARMKILDEDF